ncbi:hypothetical protein [Bacillus sp. T33-2]|uniref:hypothetical protein n=1 Tax=Bacillus sp. T33-2 TaxID=2054168 RepID=UPI002155CDFB|nr:hypothetical protein [Bacillus sp. T33-2]
MDKNRILLICSAGMSTSMLMTKMQKCAEERGIYIEVMAIASTIADKFLAKEKVDVVLLGPQVKYLRGRAEHKQ